MGTQLVEGRCQLVEGRIGRVACQPEGFAVDRVEGAIEVLLLTVVDNGYTSVEDVEGQYILGELRM
jgi:hypothetical protein